MDDGRRERMEILKKRMDNKDVKINPNNELDNETAANWVTPILPTIILSTTPTVICPNWLSIIGNERNKFFLIWEPIFIRLQI